MLSDTLQLLNTFFHTALRTEIGQYQYSKMYIYLVAVLQKECHSFSYEGVPTVSIYQSLLAISLLQKSFMCVFFICLKKMNMKKKNMHKNN